MSRHPFPLPGLVLALISGCSPAGNDQARRPPAAEPVPAVAPPAKTPADIVARINAGMVEMLSRPAVRDKFKILGVVPRSSTPQELVAMNAADAKLWGPIITAAHIKVE